jgi:cGMP-dependent protein kinase
MGAGASADNARNTVNHMLSNKPADASDITDLEQARAEIRNLRRIARDFQNSLKEETKVQGSGNIAKKREAVYDRGEQIKSSMSYVPKVVSKPETIKGLLLDVVNTNILFASYAAEEHAALVAAFEPRDFAEGVFVITQGEPGDHFYVVELGELDIYVKGKDNGVQNKVGSTLRSGSCFGELALMYNTPRQASIKARTACTLWEIDRQVYRGIITHYKYIRNKQYMEFMRNVTINDQKLGSIMSEDQLEKMTVSLEREIFEAGETIVRQGNAGDHFYIISSGTVGIYKADNSGKEQKLATLHEGNYFGEQALLKEDVRQASCVAETKVVCLTLGRDDFVDMMGSFEDLMNKEKRHAAEVEMESAQAKLQHQEQQQVAFTLDCTLEDIAVKATLGCGAFGRVKLAYVAAEDQYFALKCQAKRSIVESGLQEHVLNEIRVMKKINHPYIAKLYLALQDKQYIYFVLELLQGGELFTHLRNRGKLTEVATRFYAATVVYAFSTLHAKKIAYRDLKPENLVMDSTGYVKLVDFGLAKQLLSGKTWTLCGTPDYLAPEIILNEGHDLAVDYWALGVLIFEMVVGAPPFYADDPMEVYEKILSGTPNMPSYFTRNLSDLIKKLLRSQQGKRLGNTRGGTAAVVKHKWFSSFDWASIESGEMPAPYVPTISAKDDVTNFDQFDEGDMPGNCDWNPDLAA